MTPKSPTFLAYHIAQFSRNTDLVFPGQKRFWPLFWLAVAVLALDMYWGYKVLKEPEAHPPAKSQSQVSTQRWVRPQGESIAFTF